jgi:hypothetical protein
MEKDLLMNYIDTGLTADRFDAVLAIAGRFETPEDSKEIYEKLIGFPPQTDAEWAALMRAVGALEPDYLKSDLLLQIAPKMPRTDSLRVMYRMAAKSIQSDNDYGKVMRAVE